ncbi:MAG: sterol desaturase family protein [Bacteroidota bacterium]
MERYAAILNYAIPFFLLLLLIEAFVAWRMKKKVIRGIDTLSSLSSGVTNVIKDVLGLTLIIVSYEWFVLNIAVFSLNPTWYVYILAFIGLDFAGYWNHRLSHEVNYFWNVHIIHHSSEEFNLACALRQSISGIFSTIPFFLIPTALLGVPPQVIAIIAPLHLFAQYWYHTRLIGKMGLLEKILVTPSHHRVHHAINDEYLDKNLSQIFIIWDKLFGTFQEELDEVPPVYGVKRPVRTWNPIIINFIHLWQLVKDAWHARTYWDKIRIWFMPTGWRPQDVQNKYPVDSIQNVYKYQKYYPSLSTGLQGWCWIQLVMIFGLMMYMFANLATIGSPEIFIYGGFLIFAVFSNSMMMDKHPMAIYFEVVKTVIAIGIIIFTGDWFLLSDKLSYGQYILAMIFFVSTLISGWYFVHEIKNNPLRPLTLRETSH